MIDMFDIRLVDALGCISVIVSVFGCLLTVYYWKCSRCGLRNKCRCTFRQLWKDYDHKEKL